MELLIRHLTPGPEKGGKEKQKKRTSGEGLDGGHFSDFKIAVERHTSPREAHAEYWEIVPLFQCGRVTKQP